MDNLLERGGDDVYYKDELIFTVGKFHNMKQLNEVVGIFNDSVTAKEAEQYAIRKMIEENESILEMAKLHMDARAVIVLQHRIDELKKELK